MFWKRHNRGLGPLLIVRGAAVLAEEGQQGFRTLSDPVTQIQGSNVTDIRAWLPATPPIDDGYFV